MKALGITAMILAIVAIFVPIVGPYLTLSAALLAAFSAGRGLTFGAVALLVNVLNIVLLSPSLWLTAGLAEMDKTGDGGLVLLGLGVMLIGAQVVAGLLLAILHIIWKRRQLPVEA